MRAIADKDALVIAELLADTSAGADGGVLLAYANAVSGDGDRWSCGGLAEVDRLLSDPDAEVERLVILSFESRESILSRRDVIPCAALVDPETGIPFIRLPASAAHIRTVLRSKRAAKLWRSWKGWLTRFEAGGRRLDLSNADYRHSYKNLIGAVRIFLGALQAGHIAEKAAEAVLRELAESEVSPGSRDELSSKLSGVIKNKRRRERLLSRVAHSRPPASGKCEPVWAGRLRSYERLVSLRDTRPIIPGGYKALMLDNEYDTRGWKKVLTALAGPPANITFAATWGEAVEALSGGDFDVMLLDYDLGDSTETGLELLASLRSVHAGLPVVMVTAFDNAELALWSLRAGCNDFYVKELEDKLDRSSLDYYSRFVDALVRTSWEWERDLRSLWRDFEARLPLDQRSRDDEQHIRYAFYLLFSLADDTTWWTRGAAGVGRGDVATEDFISRAAVLSIIACDSVRVPLRSPAERICKRARHPGNVISRRNALTVLEGAVKHFRKAPSEEERRFDAPCFPAGCRIRHNARMGGAHAPGNGRRRAASFGHLERSRLGAAQFLHGHVLKSGGGAGLAQDDVFDRSPSGVIEMIESLRGRCAPVDFEEMRGSDTRVVLIDDEGDVNGWFDALRLVLGERVEWYASVGHFIRARSALAETSCVILLDLWLYNAELGRPSPDEGLRALEELRRHDVAMPVIVLSAATDSLNAIRCMKLGALDYVPKWLPEEGGARQWVAFADSLLDRVRVAAPLGDVGEGGLRALWRLLSETMTARSPLQDCPQLLDAIGQWDNGAAVGGERLTEMRRAFQQLILPALILYHSSQTSFITNGDILPLDDWRVRRVLRTRDAVANDVILFAGRAVEFLGQMRCGIEHPLEFTKEMYKKQALGSYSQWIRAASAKAGEVWDARNIIKRRAKTGAADPNASEILWKAISALTEFEAKAAQELATGLARGS